MDKIKVGIIGATGMVGQRFLLLLENHPYFEVSALAASSHSAGKTYEEAVGKRWKMTVPLPDKYKAMVVSDASDVSAMAGKVNFVFCAVDDRNKQEICELEEAYAKAEIPVVSNNSANRWTPDVPMIIPEINSSHVELIEAQKKRLDTKRGFIAVKPNCSIQAYTAAITPLLKYKPTQIVVTTYQAVSGAGRTLSEWPEMEDNVIPFISGEEEKSENEPLKIWGQIKDGAVIKANAPLITSQCIRVPVSNGHMSAVFVKFADKPSKEEILKAWHDFSGKPQELALPSAPEQFITYFNEDNRPQTRIDRDIYNGMGISVGRLREDTMFDYKFVCLSHNTLRGAAGGGVLCAELLYRLGYLR